MELPSRDALALSDFATHAATSRMRVIALAKVGMPQPSFTDAIISHLERYDFGLAGERIHLAIEGSTGGTSLGLHLATDVINSGQLSCGLRLKCRSRGFPNFFNIFPWSKLTISRHELWRTF